MDDLIEYAAAEDPENRMPKILNMIKVSATNFLMN